VKHTALYSLMDLLSFLMIKGFLGYVPLRHEEDGRMKGCGVVEIQYLDAYFKK